MKSVEAQKLLPAIFQRTIAVCEFYIVEGAGVATIDGTYDRVDDTLYIQRSDSAHRLHREDMHDNRGDWTLSTDEGRTVVYHTQYDPQTGHESWISVATASDPAPTVIPGSSNPLQAFLNVMELLQTPAEYAIAHLDQVLDPRRTPDKFVPLLARWVDLDRLIMKRLHGKDATVDRIMPAGLGRFRELIANAAHLSKWRGTSSGLLLFLQTATGLSGFQINEQVSGNSGRSIPFHIRVTAPPGAEIHRDLISEIIESEKPAYVTYELTFATANENAANGKNVPG